MSLIGLRRRAKSRDVMIGFIDFVIYRILFFVEIWYRVIHKNVSHKSEEKMHEKVKKTSQKDKNLVHEQHQYDICFCKKRISLS